MPDRDPITIWHWAGFIVAMVLFLALDLGLFHRSPRVIKTTEALVWTAIWFVLAMIFAGGLAAWRGPGDALEFVTGYFVEFSLSMDNVAAIALIFASFGVAAAHQHRVLFWGILGALVGRGLFIGLGAVLIRQFHWVLYLMGAFLVLTGLKWAFSGHAGLQPGKNIVLRLAEKIFPIADDAGEKFLGWKNGRRALTPLALTLLAVETTDLLFAVDSVPAVFAVTQKAFIVFASNCFAILGLRSLYFAVAGAIVHFKYLKAGLATVLIVVGAKMLAAPWYQLPTGFSLLVVAVILSAAVIFSIPSLRGKESR
jgi:tellurite resistance protein TerC